MVNANPDMTPSALGCRHGSCRLHPHLGFTSGAQHAAPPSLAHSDQAANRSTPACSCEGAPQRAAVILHIAKVAQSLWRKARQCCSRSAHLLTSFISSGLPNHWASWSRLALYSFLGSVVKAQGTSSSCLHPEGPFLTPYHPTEAIVLLSPPSRDLP